MGLLITRSKEDVLRETPLVNEYRAAKLASVKESYDTWIVILLKIRALNFDHFDEVLAYSLV
jgi:hypothetical protein